MAYTERLWIRCPHGGDKAASIGKRNSQPENRQNPIIHICIYEDTKAEDVSGVRKDLSTA